MRSFTIVINDKESGAFAFEEGFSIAAVDIVDAAIKANDVCMAVSQTIREERQMYRHINPDFIRVNSIEDMGVLLGYDANTPTSSWISEYVTDMLKRNLPEGIDD